MIEQLKNILLILAIAYGGYIHWQFSNYKESTNAQIIRNQAAKAATEAEQNRRYADAQAGYDGALAILNERLRNIKTVPRCSGVQVARQSGVAGTMPGETTDTAITYTPLATRKGACESSFYWDALADIAQCRELIKLCK
jgi:hypothetical protein